MDEAKIVSWLAANPQFITTCSVCFILYFIVAKHIPLLLGREDKHRETTVAALKEMTTAIKGLERAYTGGATTKRESRRLKKPSSQEPTGQ